MSTRRLALLASLIAACALAASGCGAGHSATRTTAAAEARLTARWRSGLVGWSRAMLRALDQVSLLVATQEAVVMLAEPHSAVRRELVPYERSLAACATRVRRLGPEPSTFGPARTYALHACAELERGEQLLEAAVVRLGRGGANDLDSAVGPFSDGQGQLGLATEALRTTTDASRGG